MKINFLTNPLNAFRSLSLMLICVLAYTGVFAQTLPQSGTCFFTGETIVNGVNTNDTLPRITLGLLPGTCTALVTIPKPPLNTPGCASVQQNSAGPLVLASETGCSFTPWGCNTCFGCQVQTITTVVGPPTYPVAPPATPPAGVCASAHVAVPAALVVTNNCSATFGSATYTLQIASAAGGPYTNLAPNITLGNGNVTYTLPVAGPLYTVGNNFVRPTGAWGATTFGEGKPGFQLKTFGAYVPCVDSNMTPGATLDTFTGMAGNYYRVFRSIAANCALVRAVLPVTIRDVEPPTFAPACPKGNLVSLNAGPGECGAYWDAPQFMAMDNCPASDFFSGQLRSVGCVPTPQFASVSGGTWGYLFDIQNNGSTPANIQGFETWFHSLNTGITTGLVNPNGQYEYWFKTAANTSWKTGWTGTITGAGGCLNGAGNNSSKTLWTLGASTTANSGIRVFGWQNAATAASIDTFDVTGAGKLYDTIRCPDRITVDSSRKGGGKLTLNPGEIRGIFLASAPGSMDAFILPNFGGCAGGSIGSGDIKMNVSTASPSGIIIDYAGGANIGGSGGNFQCAAWGYPGNIIYGATNNMIRPVQYCGAPYGPGCFFPIGCTKLCYSATDAQGNVATCEFNVCVNAFANPTRALACQDDIQISLDDTCFATINSSMVLSGGPYACYDNYTVEIRDWITNVIIDRRPTVKGSQVGVQDIGRALKITVRDPVTGNSCWSHATVEDKLPPKLTCPANSTISCAVNPIPLNTGTPAVNENCGSYSLSYKDNVTEGSCALGYTRIIVRTWTAIDNSNNKGTCVQTITIKIGDLFDVKVPAQYDGLPGNQPMLACDAKINRVKDYTPHYTPSNECVDGYLLDSAVWYARPNLPNIYSSAADGGTSGRRVPRALGWNCIDDPNDVNFGHPSPDPVYYPAHPDWSATNPRCWGPNTHIMWIGTGRPTANCKNFGVTYRDIIINLATPGCDAGPIGCYKVLRQWTVLDWCTGTLGGHNQVIKVADVKGPDVLYPDTVIVNTESLVCTGLWEVPPAWIQDNCSNEVHYSVQVDAGDILGDEKTGFVVVNMPLGLQNGYINATDCCGNITKKRIAINVVDQTPPTAVCDRNTVVSINGLQSAGNNITKVFAETFDDGSFDNCAPHVFFKVIRMEELINTPNGRTPPFDNRVSCNGLNGDDDPDPILAPGNQVYFDDDVKFCCADVGQVITVVFRVFDVDPGPGPVHPNRFTQPALRGHYSDCMVQVEVQDKSAPSVVAPPDIVVSCAFWFDIDKLTDPNDATFGRVVTNLSDRHHVATNDIVCAKYCVRNDLYGYPPYNPTAPPNNQPAQNKACDAYRTKFDTAHKDRVYSLEWGFDGYALAACAVAPRISVSDLRECGHGRILRNISVQGPTGARQSVTQTIHIVDCSPFYIDPVACNDQDDIQWPDCGNQGTIIEGCGARDWSPDNPALGRPIVLNGADDNCALISIEYKDETFTIEPDACLKIIRTWTVIDWCQYEPFRNPGQGRWEHQQVIKIRDRQKPVVTCNIGKCEVQGTAVIDPKTGWCMNHIDMCATAYDSCSPVDWLKWEYKIDLFNDGKGKYGTQSSGYDIWVGSITKRDLDAGQKPQNHDNPYADDENNPVCASGTYPVGIHKIRWFVEDGCGNLEVCENLFEIKDCKRPTPYCLTGVITVPMPSTGCVTIWAKDLDRGSYDNCTPQKDLKFYFNGDTSAHSRTICCDDFVAAGAANELILDVEMWVEDAEGNSDYCKTTVIVQDNQNICPGGSSFKIVGELKTEKTEEAKGVDVELFKTGSTSMLTQRPGSPYLFGDKSIVLPNTSYTIKPLRNDDAGNGVSTADIVAIQKHILGTSLITSPYKLIAADVNNSAGVTAADISEIRKVVLGINTEFSKVQSWTFVPKSYVFADPSKPWSAPRTADVTFGGTSEEKRADFVVIKNGDVTGNATAGANKVTVRTAGALNLEINDSKVVAGESYKVDFKASDFTGINGYQFTMKFDANALVFEGLTAGVLNTTDANFSTAKAGLGIITTSWNSNKGESFNNDQVLFSVTFKATRNGNLGSLIAINSDVTTAEAYSDTDVKAVKLNARTDKGSVETGVFDLYQNEPNPFSKSTVVSFSLPEAGAVKLTVYDVTGKVARVYEINGSKGLNTKTINKAELNASGVMYYQLDAKDHTATKRMVIME